MKLRFYNQGNFKITEASILTGTKKTCTFCQALNESVICIFSQKIWYVLIGIMPAYITAFAENKIFGRK